MSRRRVLVTGATGFVGRALLPRLIERADVTLLLLEEFAGAPLPAPLAENEVAAVARDLAALPEVAYSEPDVILRHTGLLTEARTADLTPEQFCQGLEVELEHGITFPDANVTNNHPLLTGKIVLAHLKEMLDYYDRLNVAELEGDLLKATRAGNADKTLGLYRRLLAARAALLAAEAKAVAPA